MVLAVVCAACGPPAAPPAPPGFEIHPDFTIELVASEPVIFDPVDLEWDERGRVFVLEMPGYPFRDEDGRVVLLEDTDGDGTWDQRQVFAEGFPVAVGIVYRTDAAAEPRVRVAFAFEASSYPAVLYWGW